jgi:23S rRNA (cytidine2498-2'-O)-methyltransferase
MRSDVYISEPGWEQRLVEELHRTNAVGDCHVVGDGWLEAQSTSDESSDPCVALAAQCLPNAEWLTAASISQWARQSGSRLIERLSTQAGPWRLHVFCTPSQEASVTPARCRYIREEIETFVRKNQRRLLKTLVRDHALVRQPNESLVQVVLRTRSSGYFSVAGPSQWRRLRRVVSRFPGGVVEIERRPRAPSRAFAKLAEAQMRGGLSFSRGQTCVDLGSSPGSWAWWALEQGADVLAVDRSPLREDLMRHKRLAFLRGDAFRFVPPVPVDWLLCDVIAVPTRSIQLLQTWLTQGWCRNFVVTIKFRGQHEYDRLEPLKTWLASSNQDFCLRRLTGNKNEVTAFGSARQSDESASCGV